MLSCEECQNLLPQYIADGEPPSPTPAGLREHLAACAACRGYAVRLRYVEVALHAYPMVAVPPELAARIATQLLPDEPQPAEQWEWLPWDVWVPALALLVALALASFSVPLPAISATPSVAVNPVTVGLGPSIQEWVASLGDGSFWVIWTAASLTLAIIGFMVGMNAWKRAEPSQHQVLHERVDDVTRRLGGFIGRTS